MKQKKIISNKFKIKNQSKFFIFNIFNKLKIISNLIKNKTSKINKKIQKLKQKNKIKKKKMNIKNNISNTTKSLANFGLTEVENIE